MMRRNTSLIPLILIVAPAITACRSKPEPSRPVPESWKTWEWQTVSFRYPETLSATSRPLDSGDIEVFLNQGKEPGKLIVILAFGGALRRPIMAKSKALGPSISTRIAGFDAERFGPGQDGTGAFSEGILDLGGGDPIVQAHFCYGQLNPAEQEQAETIIASLRKPH
jgi:hypothetical protein